MAPEDTPGAAASAPELSDLEKKMADLKAKIEAAKAQKAQEADTATKVAAEAEAKAAQETAEQKEAGIVEGVKEMESGRQEDTDLETERVKLQTEVANAEKQAEEFQQMLAQAKELGLAVEEDAGFVAAMQANKDKLAGLEQRQGELRAGMEEQAAANPEVIGRIQEEAEKEDLEMHSEGKLLKLLHGVDAELSPIFSDRDENGFSDFMKSFPGDSSAFLRLRDALISSESFDDFLKTVPGIENEIHELDEETLKKWRRDDQDKSRSNEYSAFRKLKSLLSGLKSDKEKYADSPLGKYFAFKEKIRGAGQLEENATQEIDQVTGSERVDDFEKARAMAEAGNYNRTDAAERRARIEDGSVPSGWADSAAATKDRIAEDKESRAARMFELKKSYPDLSDEEIKFVNWKQEEERTQEEIEEGFRLKFGKDLPARK